MAGTNTITEVNQATPLTIDDSPPLDSAASTAQLAGIPVTKSSYVGESPTLQTDALVADSGSLQNGQVSTVYPAGGDDGQQHTIVVNGIDTDSAGATTLAQTIADSTGTAADLVYQQSAKGDIAIKEAGNLLMQTLRRGAFGAGSEIAGLKENIKEDLANPVAEAAVAQQINQQLGANPDLPVNIVAYSQGAAITSSALRSLAAQNTDLSRVNVLSVGGAAEYSDFPPGVNVTQLYHRNDPVSQIFGNNSTPIIESVGRALDSGKRLGPIPLPSLNPSDVLNRFLEPHSYLSDANALSIIDQWQRDPRSVPANISLPNGD